MGISKCGQVSLAVNTFINIKIELKNLKFHTPDEKGKWNATNDIQENKVKIEVSENESLGEHYFTTALLLRGSFIWYTYA